MILTTHPLVKTKVTSLLQYSRKNQEMNQRMVPKVCKRKKLEERSSWDHRHMQLHNKSSQEAWNRLEIRSFLITKPKKKIYLITRRENSKNNMTKWGIKLRSRYRRRLLIVKLKPLNNLDKHKRASEVLKVYENCKNGTYAFTYLAFVPFNNFLSWRFCEKDYSKFSNNGFLRFRC